MIYFLNRVLVNSFISHYSLARKNQLVREKRCYKASDRPSVIPRGEEEEDGEGGGAAEHDVAHHVEEAEADHGGRSEGREPAVTGGVANMTGADLLKNETKCNE